MRSSKRLDVQINAMALAGKDGVEIGFTPTYVKIVQAVTGDVHEWFAAEFSEDTAQYGSSLVAATGARTVQTAAASGIVAGDGDTDADGVPDQAVGIEIGATCPINDDGVNFYVYAVSDVLNKETYTPDYYNS